MHYKSKTTQFLKSCSKWIWRSRWCFLSPFFSLEILYIIKVKIRKKSKDGGERLFLLILSRHYHKVINLLFEGNLRESFLSFQACIFIHSIPPQGIYSVLYAYTMLLMPGDRRCIQRLLACMTGAFTSPSRL